jgi:hypothetical protein
MKLIFCSQCQDVLKLLHCERSCHCGGAWGRYLDDGVLVEIRGSAVPLGFLNSQLAAALRHRPESGMGTQFTAFVIAKSCDTVRFIGPVN